MCPALRILLTFASRSGSRSGAIVPGCSAGPWRFIVSVVGLFGAGHREGRRMRIRRDIPTGNGVEARESFPGPVLRRRRCFGRAHLMSPSAGAVSPGEEWSRPKLGRRPARVGVGEFTVPPELADTQPHPSRSRARRGSRAGRNLVDPASSHMLVSKIKPCMSQYKLLYGETANGSLKQL